MSDQVWAGVESVAGVSIEGVLLLLQVVPDLLLVVLFMLMTCSMVSSSNRRRCFWFCPARIRKWAALCVTRDSYCMYVALDDFAVFCVPWRLYRRDQVSLRWMLCHRVAGIEEVTSLAARACL